MGLIMPNTASVIIGAVKEALELWKTFIATRQQAYERKMDKRQERAIQYAEEAFTKINLLYDFLYKNVEIPKVKQAEFTKLKETIYKLRDKFNRYD